MTDGWLKALVAALVALAGLLAWWGRRARHEAQLVSQAKCDARHDAERKERAEAEQGRPKNASHESLQGALAHVRHLEDRLSTERTQAAERLTRVETRLEALGESMARIEIGITELRGGSGGRRRRPPEGD